MLTLVSKASAFAPIEVKVVVADTRSSAASSSAAVRSLTTPSRRVAKAVHH